VDDNDDDSGDDVQAFLVTVTEAAASSLPIPPSGSLRRLGFLLLDEFLVSLGV
jgi:hypothetical protein